MYRYKIADIGICVKWENETQKNRRYSYHDCIVLPRSLEAFRDDEPRETPDMDVLIRELKSVDLPNKYKMIYNQAFYKIDNIMHLTVFDPFNPKIPGYSISMTEDYRFVEYTPHIIEYANYDLQWMMFPFEGRALQKGSVVLHGAAVEFENKAFIFTGISGIGKSTQANLWQKYRNALILNGDCPLIKVIDGDPMVFGTPFCGTSGQYINRNAPLIAIVLLKKGATNTLRELKGNEALLAMLANVLHSNFDKVAVDLAIERLNSFCDNIRVLELTCTIDTQAVALLEKELFYN